MFEWQLGFHNLSHTVFKRGSNIVAIKYLIFVLMTISFELDWNVIAIKSFNDPFVKQCIRLVFEPSAIEPLGSLKFEALKFFVWTAYNQGRIWEIISFEHACDRGIRPLIFELCKNASFEHHLIEIANYPLCPPLRTKLLTTLENQLQP